MGKSLTYKILEDHLIKGELKVGSEIAIKIDQTLTQDATGTCAYLQFESIGIDRVKTELSVSYVDHNTIQIGFENADDHRYLQSVAQKYGIIFSRPGNGICHQVHLERFGEPGKTLLGSDSHTPTAGALGMLAIGAGGLDVAVAMGGGPFYLTCPKVIRINLIGELKPWVSAKDIILKILQVFGTKGNVGCVFEYGGDIEALSVPERATITNMGAECGVTTSIFPSDEITKDFLKAQGREEDWIELKPDNDAFYDKVIDIKLDEIIPLAACPHSPDNIKPVKEIEGIKVHQVCVGSCTNSSYKDLYILAHILKGKTIHPGLNLVVTPGSKQVLENIAKNGILSTIISSGARITEPSCGFCIGNSHSPPSEGVSIRTSNRNFEGRSGTKNAQVFLTSVETAAACALTGKITDPRDLDLPYPKIKIPERFEVNDNMILQPSKEPQKIKISRGPNIAQIPSSAPLPDQIEGAVTIKLGDKITTDHIIPAGNRMKYRSNIPKYSEFVFENIDKEFYKRALNNKQKGLFNIIVGGESYGQGSSREHAALCPMFLGVKAIIAKSFERIHAANLVNFGILPLIFDLEESYADLELGDIIKIQNLHKALSKNEKLTIKNMTKNKEFVVRYKLSDRQRQIIMAGGLLPFTKNKES